MNRAEKEESFYKAKQIVYRLLNIRLRSEQELRDKLTSKKLPIPIVEQTIAYFCYLGLIDDRQFARQWISSRLKKPFGLNRIRLELQKKGIDAAIIQKTLQEASTDYNELEAATRLANHRALAYKNVQPTKRKQRVFAYLQRRGFNMSTITKAVDTL